MRFAARERFDYPNGAIGWRPGGQFDCLGGHMGYRFETPIEGDYMDGRRAAIVKAWPKVDGRRAAFAPLPSTPKVARAGVTVTAAEWAKVLGAFGAVLTKHRGTADYARIVAARTQVAPGWAVLETDGRAAICELAGGLYAGASAPLSPLGTLPLEAWRDYGRARVLRPNSDSLTWTFAADRVTFETSTPDLGEARAWTPIAGGAEGSFILSDAYAWPLRGAAWAVSWTGSDAGPIVFAVPGGDKAIVIMPMRR